MEYHIEHFGQLKKYLSEMWGNTDLKDPTILATIVSATAFKNMPKTTEVRSPNENNSGLYNKPVNNIKKETYESVNDDNAPPVFVYEF